MSSYRRLRSGWRGTILLHATIIAATLVGSAGSASSNTRVRDVLYSSECSCENDHGVVRWRAKTDRSEPPRNPADIRQITPSQMYAWIGPGMLPRGGGRSGNELKWFALTGRVVGAQAESDGDVHIVLADAEGNRPGKAIAEIPLGDRWCAMRTTAFSWTNATFPFTANWQFSPFRLVRRPVITVIGKAFYDTDHSGKNVRNNRRPRDKEKAVWEIHPVMQLIVERAADDAAAPTNEPAPPPLASVSASPASSQFVTIRQSLRVRIPYGETVIPAGTKLEIISRDATTARVRYLGEIQTIPISATDLQ